jgi:hypothetical protein
MRISPTNFVGEFLLDFVYNLLGLCCRIQKEISFLMLQDTEGNIFSHNEFCFIVHWILYKTYADYAAGGFSHVPKIPPTKFIGDQVLKNHLQNL